MDLETNNKPSSASNALTNFLTKARSGRLEKAIPTGFTELDKILLGGLRQGLITVGANSGTGKTTFCLQMACQIAQSGRDVLFYSLEMSQDVILAKALSFFSCLRLRNDKEIREEALTVTDILGVNIWREAHSPKANRVQLAIEDFKKISDHLFIIDNILQIGTSDIDKKIEQFQKSLGVVPVVVIDYLQLLKSPDDSVSERQAVDRNLDSLNEISLNYQTPIVLISSVNRTSYDSPIDKSSFKESGKIEFSSSVLLSMDLAGMDKVLQEEKYFSILARQSYVSNLRKESRKRGQNQQSQRIQVSVLKQKIGPEGSFEIDFYPAFNFYAPVVAAINEPAAGKMLEEENKKIEKAKQIKLEAPYQQDAQ